MTDEQTLNACRDSLHEVASIRDFVLAIKVGSTVAVDMLDKIENKLVEVLASLNEDRG
jgi:hypothetical protein